MPFGLKNALATFQLVVDIILSTFSSELAVVYPDDIVIFWRTPHKHNNWIRLVSNLLREAGVTSKLTKCVFYTNKIDHLDHVIQLGRLEVTSHTKNAKTDLKTETTERALRSFNELCNVFRTSVSDYARLTVLLTAQLREEQAKKVGWLNTEELTAIRTLQE